MDVLINGNQADGSESAPVIGVNTIAEGITYKDLLRTWVRGSRLGRVFRTLIGDESAAIDILDLPEFKIRMYGQPQSTMNLKTPVPSSSDFYIHPGVPEIMYYW